MIIVLNKCYHIKFFVKSCKREANKGKQVHFRENKNKKAKSVTKISKTEGQIFIWESGESGDMYM